MGSPFLSSKKCKALLVTQLQSSCGSISRETKVSLGRARAEVHRTSWHPSCITYRNIYLRGRFLVHYLQCSFLLYSFYYILFIIISHIFSHTYYSYPHIYALLFVYTSAHILHHFVLILIFFIIPLVYYSQSVKI